MFQGHIDFDTAAPVGADTIQNILFERGLYWASGRAGLVDLVAAHKWFNLSALKGRADAITMRREVAEMMTEVEIATAQRDGRVVDPPGDGFPAERSLVQDFHRRSFDKAEFEQTALDLERGHAIMVGLDRDGANPAAKTARGGAQRGVRRRCRCFIDHGHVAFSMRINWTDDSPRSSQRILIGFRLERF